MRNMKKANMNRGKEFIIWCDKAMAFSFYALIYFLPISIALSEIFTGLALLFYLLKRLVSFCVIVGEKAKEKSTLSFLHYFILFFRSFRPVDSYLNKPILILLSFSLISVFVSRYPMLSIKGFFGKVLQSAFLYFNFIECINSKKRLKKFFIVFLISATLISINGLYQYFMGKDFIHGHLIRNGRISSSFRADNDFAAYLVVVVPILLNFSLLNTINGIKKFSGIYVKKDVFSPFLSGNPGKAWIFIVFILSFICLGLTFSRGAWVAFALVMFIFSVRKKRYIIINGLILILFFGLFYPRLQETRQVSLIVDSVREKGDTRQAPDVNGEKQGTAVSASVQKKTGILETYKEMLKLGWIWGGSGRSEYWKEAIHIIKDYPFFGVGLNTYSVVGRGYKITWGGYPHNCYLQMAAETGILGLLSFLWLSGVLFYRSFRNLAAMQDPFLAMFLFGSLIGLGGFLTHSFFDTNFYSVQLGSFMWLIMGLIVAIQKVEKDLLQ